jgi:hypothetical protein
VSVFISWSGENSASRRVAEILKKYIQRIIQGTSCYVSTETEAGQVWVDTLFTELQGRNIGLLCVTRDNYQKPWINFEAGALAKNYGKSRVCPILIDLKTSDVPPLSAFQMKTLEKSDVFSILEMLNQNRGNPLILADLEEAFDVRWPEFERELKEAINLTDSSTETDRRTWTCRNLHQKNFPKIDSLKIIILSARPSFCFLVMFSFVISRIQR